VSTPSNLRRLDRIAATQHLCEHDDTPPILVLITFDDDEMQSALRSGATDDGVPLRVEEVGSASIPVTVVFVHGFCLHMGSWYFQRRDLPTRTGARLVVL